MDNSKLEELMKEEITPEMQKEFFEIFMESQLFLPIMPNENMFKGIENAKVGDVVETDGQVGFKINYITDSDGSKAVPLFTSSEVMESTGFRSSVFAIYMCDLADMLKETDMYSLIAINPFTDHDLNMPIDAFLNLFEDQPSQEIIDSIYALLKLLDEFFIELDDEYGFYLRGNRDIMKTYAVDGVFTPTLPLSVHSKREFEKDRKYLNIVLMPKGSRIVFLGDDTGETQHDTIIAPESRFVHVDDADEYTSVWRCVAQPYYDVDKEKQ